MCKEFALILRSGQISCSLGRLEVASQHEIHRPYLNKANTPQTERQLRVAIKRRTHAHSRLRVPADQIHDELVNHRNGGGTAVRIARVVLNIAQNCAALEANDEG